MIKLITALSLVLSITAQANDANKAADYYSKRDFTADGIENVKKAVEIYDNLVASEPNADTKMTYQMKLAQSHYFLGSALEDKDERKAHHQKGVEQSDAIITGLGIENAHELTQEQLDQLKADLNDTQELNAANAFYYKGINMAQHGNLSGITSSIGRLPEVRGLMNSIRGLGHESLSSHGPDRTEGRIDFKVPGFLGGDIDRSEDFLKNAVKNTRAAGQNYSVNGFNNVYLAETFHKNDKEDKAEKLLKAFIDADPATLDQDSQPENRKALELAKELAEEWGI